MPNIPPTPLQVLVVDDSATNLDIMEAILSQTSCQVRCVNNGADAIRAAAETSFDLIFMDCQMPHMNGFTATREIRKQEIQRHTPIIALTANAIETVRTPCTEAGMDDILIKPALLDALSGMLQKWARHLDPAVLDNLREALNGSGSTMFVEAIASYLKESVGHLRALEEAATIQDAESIKQAAHILKGSSGYFGARRMQDLCLRIETLVENKRMNDLPQHVKELQDEFQRVRGSLETEARHRPA